jgi:hypothetical protein
MNRKRFALSFAIAAAMVTATACSNNGLHDQAEAADSHLETSPPQGASCDFTMLLMSDVSGQQPFLALKQALAPELSPDDHVLIPGTLSVTKNNPALQLPLGVGVTPMPTTERLYATIFGDPASSSPWEAKAANAAKRLYDELRVPVTRTPSANAGGAELKKATFDDLVVCSAQEHDGGAIDSYACTFKDVLSVTPHGATGAPCPF